MTFALAAKRSGVSLHICNDQIYGFIPVPLDNREDIEDDKQKLINIKLEILAFQGSLPLSQNLKKFVSYPKKDTMSMSKVYVINLLRRPERRRRVKNCFDELGIAVQVIDAVDGRILNYTILKSKGITVMPGYIDIYEKRPMTLGEIGCFLSHYNIWNKVVKNKYERVMIFEDDVRFLPYFRQNLTVVLDELQRLNLEWDLLFIGRQVRQDQDESLVEGSQRLVHVGYCYWALGYILSAQGAKKLLAAKPLKNLVPVDEFLPILYDKHPISDWKEKFPKRNLIALSATPLLVYPIYYIGDSGYVSDTTDSEFVPQDGEKEEDAAANKLNIRDEL
ncbi:glycosyltransferase 25 family member-like [Belonocnema kinseyi]|uniref:glycosyltransferase 25 family member-like n=1 Tax=Belonocnema kinseyi TaxID=2817044 RepID=UPI00143D081B|nr:glycosyltransferase 25 family member-like [Belonocnema kinseyi]